MLKLFNTLTRKKEAFQALSPPEVLLYTCGPTIYDFAHIGNFRTYVFEDLLRRSLKFFGFKVKQAMNLTDIDDKTIKGANSAGRPLQEYTDFYKKAFFEDLDALGIERAEFYPEATAYIPQMIALIEMLLQKEMAYRGLDGSIYFSLAKFPSYGKLSHLKLEDLQEGASQRVLLDSYDKENAADFVLWKVYDEKRDGKIFWPSPFGPGRPGWHIECSAMAMSLLGETIDLHCGGVDNIFPHHENEIAQSEAFSGKPFVRFWLHSEHLLVDNKKMSKSLKNFYTLRDLLAQGYDPRQVRYLLLQTHYRTQLNFTFEGLEAAGKSLRRIFDFIERLKQIKIEKPGMRIEAVLDSAKEKFTSALSDDLNISVALSSLFDLIREINFLCDRDKLGFAEANMVLVFLDQIDQVLGVMEIFKEKKESFPEEVRQVFEKRNLARSQKDFLEADRLRDRLLEKGYVIEDTPAGPVLKKKI
ncbi:MAG: cysteine--tRNA ligase [Parachlamydiales bacterium]|jgi:cysteinyl-tRNA synthetase